MTLRRWVIGRMDAWHHGPHGGRCPRTRGPQCSRYGVAAVERHGAVVGTLLAARYVATCKADDDYFNCRFGLPRPDRWAAQLLLPLLAGLHLREALPKPQPGSCPIFSVLFLFARIALFGTAPPGRNCPNQRKGEGIPTR